MCEVQVKRGSWHGCREASSSHSPGFRQHLWHVSEQKVPHEQPEQRRPYAALRVRACETTRGVRNFGARDAQVSWRTWACGTEDRQPREVCIVAVALTLPGAAFCTGIVLER